jgi:hypothetical protein
MQAGRMTSAYPLGTDELRGTTTKRFLCLLVLRVLRCLERDGLLIRDSEQPWLDLESRDQPRFHWTSGL